MSTIMNFVVARLGEARHLFVVGVILALFGTISLGLAALVPQPTQQNHDGVTASPHAYRSNTQNPAPEPPHIIPSHILPERLLLMPSGGLDCLSEDVIACSAQLQRDASVAEVATFLHTNLRAMRRLNPGLRRSRLKKGDWITIDTCLDRNTLPTLPETTACRLARLKVGPNDPRIAGWQHIRALRPPGH